MRVLMVGDVVGRPGRDCVRDLLPRIKENYRVDFIMANGENAAGGVGINKKTAEDLFSFGVDNLTMGNHVWDKKEALAYIPTENRIVRPANYPPGTPGAGSAVYKCLGSKIGVLNLSGRVFMAALDCPFRVADEHIKVLKRETNIIVVDMHAEATSEKKALACYLDGKVSAVIGTHTHVQTADERILPAGTGFITDVGMTGPYDSVIGVETKTVIKRFVSQLPTRFSVAEGGKVQFNGVIIDIDTENGLTLSIERISDLHDLN